MPVLLRHREAGQGIHYLLRLMPGFVKPQLQLCRPADVAPTWSPSSSGMVCMTDWGAV